MDITTVKLRKKTKFLLDRLKHAHESYDSVIARLVHSNQGDLKAKLIEGYTRSSETDKQLVKEWEAASNEVSDD